VPVPAVVLATDSVRPNSMAGMTRARAALAALVVSPARLSVSLLRTGCGTAGRMGMDTRIKASKHCDEATKLYNPLDWRALRRGQIRTGNMRCHLVRIGCRLPEIIRMACASVSLTPVGRGR